SQNFIQETRTALAASGKKDGTGVPLAKAGLFPAVNRGGTSKGAGHPNPTEDEWATLSRGIHRSILCGLLGHIAQREGRNQYKASGNRLLTIFPGSSLYSNSIPRPKATHRPQSLTSSSAEINLDFR
ncbi:MAG: hypothetical protein EBV46_05235, partial [Burkholderiaceae bacterium]|nr:hypothetical protein [Burkholderiaceae bacterium]